MQHLIKCCMKHIDSKSYSIYAMACLYTIRGYTQYLPTGKYTNSSLYEELVNYLYSPKY